MLTKISIPRRLMLLLILIIMCIILTILSPRFLSISNISSIGISIATIAILAVGQTFVILTAGIDLSVGNVLGFVGVITALSMTNGFGLFGGIIVGILAGTLCGLINGVLVGKGKLPPFIVTLGMMGIVRGIALIVSGGFPIIIPYEIFGFLGAGKILNIPVPIIIMILLFLIGYYILKNTTIGRKTYAIGSNEDASRLSGINVSRQLIFVYALSGFTASIAGLIETARLFSAYPTAGSGYELDSIAAVVIGGTSFFGGEGSILQTLIGALIMATLRNGCNLVGVSPFVQQALIGVIIIGAVYIDRIRSRTS
jgi:ribose transport system permease protein